MEVLRRFTAPLSSRADTNVSETERILSFLSGTVVLRAAFRQRGAVGLGLGGLAGVLMYRGLTGHCRSYELLNINTASVEPRQLGYFVSRFVESISIYRPRNEVYQRFRDFASYPQYLRDVLKVELFPDGILEWTVAGIWGRPLSWKLKVIEEKEGYSLAWNTTASSPIRHEGRVHFDDAPGEKGTEVHVQVAFSPTAGPLGIVGAKVLRRSPKDYVHAALRNLKQLLETGEISTIEGQPTLGTKR